MRPCWNYKCHHSPFAARRHPAMRNNSMSNPRYISIKSRTYDDALNLLAKLQSNRHITSLFDKPKPPQDLNAAAIPEMCEWFRRAGYTPQDLTRLRHVHVAGTKGKGSVCAYATSMLQQYHGKVGTYTSPHLVSVRERIAIDGKPISQEMFATAFFELWERFTEAARTLKENEGGHDGKVDADADADVEGLATKPFFFRFLTIMAWHVFLKENVDVVVLECGIGGEYDATNILPPEAVSAAVITQLGIDHVAMLGDTVEQIAWHKAGVFKRGVSAFTGDQGGNSSVLRVLRARAAEKEVSQLVEVDAQTVEKWGGIPGKLAGEFQKYNQALAVLAVKEHLGLSLGNAGAAAALENLPEKMAKGLREVSLRGRCEVVIQRGGGGGSDLKWHLDGAHTKDSLDQVAKWFCDNLDKGATAVLIFNQQERSADELLSSFIDTVEKITGRENVFSHAIFSRNEQVKPAYGEVRDVDVQQKAAAAMNEKMPECATEVVDNIEAAVAKAQSLASEKGGNQKILVTGSLHLVGGILRALEPESLL